MAGGKLRSHGHDQLQVVLNLNDSLVHLDTLGLPMSDRRFA